MLTESSCLIIGGGITGLIAAQTLHSRGISVTILDKGRGIGGRLATRRLSHPEYGEGVIDYGAPHFTANGPEFKALVSQWLEQNLIKVWSTGFVSSNGQIEETTYYCGREGNRAIAKHLAQNLNVHTNTQVTKVVWEANYWQAHTATDQIFTGEYLLLTPPVPQSLELLKSLNLALPQKLTEVAYHPCIAVLTLLEAESHIPPPGGLWLNGNPLTWINCNHQKGISPNAYGVTLHASPEYSHSHWKSDDSSIIDDLINSASPWLGSRVITHQIHRWRYSRAHKVYGEPFLALTQPGPLILAGDGFLGSNLEGAVLSGLAAADYLWWENISSN
ncbi:NAD(P)/FAD-dependent oxidoreductase [Gloeocapsa sp. PCC 73106]|uniref:NAD(P)/FAD-dependent oxidoreductase n=1 Tax=Gloeocapsa sp. PCC 73106 TaxID=102232 RepID=UPI0002AC0E5E|nr:FAD-dependent oxidoreductase [Gloeocapsa sp. PCC 73106]ELR97000.1 putative NAD/FAD-dependent oxidoreductase [Gloeocapsa sp. PCC 73106]